MPQPREGVFASPLVGGGDGEHRTEVFLFLVSSDAAVFLLQSGEGTREAVGGGGDEEVGEEEEKEEEGRGGRGCGRSGEGGAARATEFQQAEPRSVALVHGRARSSKNGTTICGLRRRDRAER